MIHQWALDLDAAAAIDDAALGQASKSGLHGAVGAQYAAAPTATDPGEVSKERQQSTYSATSAHLTINAMEQSMSGDLYSDLEVPELRKLLHGRRLNTAHCIEKADLVKLLIKSDQVVPEVEGV
jgi:hypothetical protein